MMENPHEINTGLWCRFEQNKAAELAQLEYNKYLENLMNYEKPMKDVTPQVLKIKKS